MSGAAKGIGYVIMGVAALGGFAVWAVTTYVLATTGQTGLAFLAFFVPPADLLLSFIVSPVVGFAGIASTVLFMLGGAVASIGDKR